MSFCLTEFDALNISLCFLLAMELDVSGDSSDGLFITQSCFKTDVDTQEADNAADFFSTSFEITDSFSRRPLGERQSDKNDAVPDPCISDEVPVIPESSKECDLFTDGDVDKVSDGVLNAALDAVLAETQADDRFGAPIPDNAMKEKTMKGYVYFFSEKNFSELY